MRTEALLLCALTSCAPGITAQDPRDAEDGGSSTSRCTETTTTLHCTHHSSVISPGGLGLGARGVHWQVPLGTPPSTGWPVVLMFQGSFYSADTFWDSVPSAPYGGWSQAHVLRALLDAGFAVITPKTRFDGAYFWDTNVVGFSSTWSSTDDHHLMLVIFDAIAKGTFGKLDPARWYATGISSGGYMTSRMAISYPKKFRALAVVAASFATCSGPVCSVPTALPSDHPPTLFLHGEQDEVVPLSTMRQYADALTAQKLEARVVTDADAGHAWIPASPTEVTAWFRGHD